MLASCNLNTVYNYNKTIPESVWNQDVVVRFDIEITDTSSIFDFYLTLRHTTDYKYNNVYFFINTTFPDGNMARDTVEFILADKKGKWYGKGFGRMKDLKILLKKGLRFQHGGVYLFEFEQAMREKNLAGITDLGISIEKE